MQDTDQKDTNEQENSTEPQKQSLKERLGPKGLRIILFAVIFIVLAAGTGLFFYKRHVGSFEYALASLNTAIVAKDGIALATLVDFKKLSEDVAKSVQPILPQTPINPFAPTTIQKKPDSYRQQRIIEDTLQQMLLELVTAPEIATETDPKPTAKKITEGQGPLYSVVQEHQQRQQEAERQKRLTHDPEAVILPTFLPDDLLTQLQTKPFLFVVEENGRGIAETTIQHPTAGMNVRLRIEAHETPAGWRFMRLPEIQQIAQAYINNYQQAVLQKIDLFTRRNQDILQTMNQYCTVTSCLAQKGSTRPNGTVQFIVRLNAVNKGNIAIASGRVTCDFTDSTGSVLETHHFDIDRVVPPGEAFSLHWNNEFVANTPIAQALQSPFGMQCRPQVQTLTLADGTLLYLRKVENLFN